MPWTTPDLKSVRKMTRDFVTAAMRSVTMIPNSFMRIMSDAMSGLAHLTLRYLDWLSRQFLPDTAETEWLDRHGQIWLTNADGSKGRKAASRAAGTVLLTGIEGIVVPTGTRLTNQAGVSFATTEQVYIAAVTTDILGTDVDVEAIDAGVLGNGEAGDAISVADAVSGLNASATIVTLTGGAEEETDDELRARVLFRIQQPPMGGDANDYVLWALAVAGVTRAWCSMEMGVGTVTVRFMCDNLRAGTLAITTDTVTGGGFPTSADITAVEDYLDTMRPVAVKDFFVEAPIPELISFTISNLSDDSAATRAAISISVTAMLRERAAPAYSVNGVTQPAQTIYAAWVSEAISAAAGVEYFDLTMSDHVMPDYGYIAVLGTITYA